MKGNFRLTQNKHVIMQIMRRSRSDRADENAMIHTAVRSSIFYQTRDTKHISFDIFRQKNKYSTSTQHLDFRDAVILTWEGKLVAFIHGYLENRSVGEICYMSAAAGVIIIRNNSRWQMSHTYPNGNEAI